LVEIICDTSPLQYLHQLRHLDILPSLASRVLVPTAVTDELGEALRLGLDLPDIHALAWVEVVSPGTAPALPLVTELGPGELEVLTLALEHREAVVVLDDRVARNVARRLELRMSGTLGLLLDAKRSGRIERVEPS
jgi:predicted nucleic acid-binding protein